jgi:hypothetical protein
LRGNTPNVIIGCIDNGTPRRAWGFWKGTLVNCFIASICAKMQSGISIQSAYCSNWYSHGPCSD